MEGSLQRTGSGGLPSAASSPQRRTPQQPLSCTHCRQRKIKCDKIHPCTNCKRSGLVCVFPERVRHTKKTRDSSKALNEELLRRLGKMEELIEKLKVEGRDNDGNRLGPSQKSSPKMIQGEGGLSEDVPSPQQGGTDVNRFLGSGFWRSLTHEVQGLRQVMDDVSDDEEYSPNATHSPSDTSTSHSSTLFGPNSLLTKDLSSLHPSPAHMALLCDLYARDVDPMFKILHIPTLRELVTRASSNIKSVPSGSSVEALLFAVYYAAITSITQEQCTSLFHDDRDSLLARYRSGTEASLVNADLLNTTELGTIQALTLFIITVRANDDSQFAWTLTSVAVRLATAVGLHRENSTSGLSPFMVEIRRRLWFGIIQLDIRSCEDRGSDPIILPGTFNTKKPANINDDDMDPQSTIPIVGRHGFTEMTKSFVTYIMWQTAIGVGYVAPVQEGEQELAPKVSFEQKEASLAAVEKQVEREILIYCDSSNPLAWTTSVIARLILARLRLALYHPPLHDDRSPLHQSVSRDVMLLAAVQTLEYSHLLETDPAAEPWRWFCRTYVQWHALAAALAELCVRDSGQLVDRTWRIVEMVFNNSAARIADSRKGMLWRPMKKLWNKAQSRRLQSKSVKISPVPQRPLPPFGPSDRNQLQSLGFDDNWISQAFAPKMEQEMMPHQSSSLEQDLTPDAFSSLDMNETMDTVNWAQWDEFMRDFQMPDQSGTTDVEPMQTGVSHRGAWW